LRRIAQEIDDDREYSNKQVIVCSPCFIHAMWTGKEGLCAFTQFMEDKGTIKGFQVKASLDRLLDHNCKRCGSVTLFPGNNVKDGELTVNYKWQSCLQGLCP
jgi:hypothetical protein